MKPSLIFLCLIIAPAFGKELPKMIFKTYHTCDGGENNPVQFTNITFSQLDKETIVMNGHISIKKQLKGEIQGAVTALLCADPNNPDSCEYMFQDMEMGDLCQFLTDTKAEWSRFIENIKLPPKCPIDPIETDIKDYLVYNVFDEKLPIPHGLYKVTVKALIDDKDIGCNYIEVII